MMGHTHFVIGIGATALALTAMPADPTTQFMALAVGGVAALLPDIDSPNAKIRQLFGLGDQQAIRQLQRTVSKRFSLIAFLVALMRWGLAQLLNLIPKLIQHRGPTHWGISWLIVSLGVTAVCPLPIALAFAMGYGSHILADMMTVSGVAVFAPASKRPFFLLPKAARIRTGSQTEAVLCLLLLAVETAVLFLYYGLSITSGGGS